MRSELNTLTTPEVKAAKPGTKLYDGGGLIYSADEHGGIWSWRYTSEVTGKRREVGLGRVSLKAARIRADELRHQIAGGHDPLHERSKVAAAERDELARIAAQTKRDAVTLERYGREYHNSLRAQFKSIKHWRQWDASLENHIYPKLGKRPLAAIKAPELLAIMIPLRDQIPETAARIRLRLEAIYADAVAKGLADNNPALLIARPMRGRRKRGHFAALDYRRVPEFIQTLQESERVSDVTKLAFQFAILSAGRTGEILGARWREVDLENRRWTVPAERMKRGAEHTVFLSKPMLEILDAARAHSDGAPESFVFPGRERDQPLSNMCFLMAIRRLKLDQETTAHGFRTCFSSWARMHVNVRTLAIEAALAHSEEGVAGTYGRLADYYAERRKLSDAWGRYCTTPATSAKVVPLRA